MASSWGTVRTSSPRKGLYDPKAFLTHAALLRQAFAHCARFPAAASRRSLGRISVPVWLIILSDQLPIVALVGSYPTNQLIGRTPLLQRLPYDSLSSPSRRQVTVCGIRPAFAGLFPTRGQVSYVFLTRPPLGGPKTTPFDLHALGTPPAFILSQDQTLHQAFPSIQPNSRCAERCPHLVGPNPCFRTCPGHESPRSHSLPRFPW